VADNRADPRKRPEWDRFAPFANELFPFARTRIYVSIRTGGLLTDYRRKRISDGHTPRRVREFGESFSVTDTANVDRVKRARPIRKSKNETPIPRRAVVVAPDACYYLGAGPRESGTPYGRTRRHKNGLIRSAGEYVSRNTNQSTCARSGFARREKRRDCPDGRSEYNAALAEHVVSGHERPYSGGPGWHRLRRVNVPDNRRVVWEGIFGLFYLGF